MWFSCSSATGWPGESLNALSHEMMLALESKLHAVAGQADVRVVVITGSGRAFCAGGDLLEFEAALHAGRGSCSTISASTRTSCNSWKIFPFR